jgi:hypothetical protein
MVFDGMDEANDDKMVGLIETFVQHPNSFTRAIFLSRPKGEFDISFWKGRTVILQHENASDIAKVARHGLAKLQEIISGKAASALSQVSQIPGQYVKTHAALRRLASDAVSQSEIRRPLNLEPQFSGELRILENVILEAAENVILWVVLVLDSLYKLARVEPIVTEEKLVACVEQLPWDLNEFYRLMVEELTDTVSKSALRTARAILMWIYVANRVQGLTLEELWDALAISQQDSETEGHLMGAVSGSIAERRIAIRSWDDLNHTLRRLCGSLIEILPPRAQRLSVPGLKDLEADPESVDSETNTNDNAEDLAPGSDSLPHGYPHDSTTSGTCLVQLMHQTVKDFLSNAELAGPLHFTEDEALQLVLRQSCGFIKLALPDDSNAVFSLRSSNPEQWPWLSVQLVRNMEELRLLPLCGKLVDTYPARAQVDLTIQASMKWDGYLPRWLHDLERQQGLDLAGRWKYDHLSREYNSLTSGALGLMFQYAATMGLSHAAQGLLCLVELNDDGNFWPVYRHAVLNGILFALLERRDVPRYPHLRRTLLTPHSQRRESAILAIDARFYEQANCNSLPSVHDEASCVPVEDVTAIIETVIAHICNGKWWEDMRTTLEEDLRSRRGPTSPALAAQCFGSEAPQGNRPESSPEDVLDASRSALPAQMSVPEGSQGGRWDSSPESSRVSSTRKRMKEFMKAFGWKVHPPPG